jgi:hypothetical protein
MAKLERADLGLGGRLDELEQRMFVLKINYEKYFSGIERVEPLRERDDVKRLLRDMTEQRTGNSTQRFRLQTLKARFQSLELYWTRNLVLVERGTHPKMRFRADARSTGTGAKTPDALSAEQREVLRQRQETAEREERAYRAVYDAFLAARAQVGQSTDLAFETMRDTLRTQARQIKSSYQCEAVKFRVVLEDGKARVKAVPISGGGTSEGGV